MVCSKACYQQDSIWNAECAADTLLAPQEFDTEAVDALVSSSCALQLTWSSYHPLKLAGLYLAAKVIHLLPLYKQLILYGGTTSFL